VGFLAVLGAAGARKGADLMVRRPSFAPGSAISRDGRLFVLGVALLPSKEIKPHPQSWAPATKLLDITAINLAKAEGER
jgi:hypothetical protein